MKSEKFWDKQAKDFIEHEQHTQLSKNKDYITTLKYLSIDDTVLDYGCATGIISNAIADKVKEIHAIDISSKMIEIANRKAYERQIGNIYYAQALNLENYLYLAVASFGLFTIVKVVSASMIILSLALGGIGHSLILTSNNNTFINF